MFNRLTELFKIESADALNTKIGYAVLCLIAVYVINTITRRHGGTIVRILSNVIAVILLSCSATWIVTGAYWYNTDEAIAERHISVVHKQTESVLQGFLTMQSTYTVQNGGTLICDVYSLTSQSLSEDVVTLGQGLSGTVCVLAADDSGQHSTLTITGVTAVAGTYTVMIGDNCTINVVVVDEAISAELQLTCVPSDTVLADGGVLTLSVLYAGTSVDNGTATYLIAPTFVTLDNMVGKITVTDCTAAVYNVSVNDVCILDKTQPACVSIGTGSAVDGSGALCHPVTVEVTAEQTTEDDYIGK